MAVYYIGSYDIDDPDQFRRYGPMAMALLPKYGGQLLASDTAAFVVDSARAFRRHPRARSTSWPRSDAIAPGLFRSCGREYGALVTAHTAPGP